MFTNNKVAKSISLAIAFGAVTGLNFSTSALAHKMLMTRLITPKLKRFR
jgi:hypothetical protein